MNGKQLKNSILQWAIQGKLVPQNPKDEPASKLLERIAAKRIVASGAKQSKKNPASRIYRDGSSWFEQVGSAQPKDITEEIPFDIPESWKWCRVHNLFYVGTGLTPLKSEKRYYSKGTIPWVNSSLTSNRYIEKVDSYITEFALNQLSLTLYPVHTLIMAMYGQGKTRGQVAELLIPATVNQACAAMTCFLDNEDLVQYVYYFFLYNYVEIRRLAGGTSQPNLNLQIVKDTFIPLPPVAEQKRIVKKLEQILPLVDEYDQAQTQLDKLNKELPESLKKSILQQAIQGKLVPQNPKDEPADKLLERINISRHSEHSEESSKKSRKSSSKNPVSRIYRDTDGLWYEQTGSSEPVNISEEIPFEIPETWTWCRLGCICGYLHRGKSPTYSEKKILPVMAQKCNQWDRIYTDKCLFVDPQTIEKYAPEQYLQKGDTLINSTGGGTVGRTGYVDDYVFAEYDRFVADSHVTVVRPNENICSKYVYYYLITPYIQTGLEERCAGSTNQIELGTETIRNYLLPLPPLAEQKRIVAKLEQLFKAL